MSFDVNDIRDLSKRQSVLDFQALLRDRRTAGFHHFIPDLATEPEQAGTGWSFKKGLLVVKDPHDTNQIMDYLDSKLRHHEDWYQTRTKLAEMQQSGVIIEQPELPLGFDTYTQLFKSLGYWGKNPAMDVGTFLENEDESISSQVIIRVHDKRYAFVGGMVSKNAVEKKIASMRSRGITVTPEQALELVKQGIIKKSQQEFLEEFYSNDLFAKGSETLRRGSSINKDTLVTALQNLLEERDVDENEKEFKKIAGFKDAFLAIFKQDIGFNTKITELERKLKELGTQNGMRAEDLDVLWVRIKCRLYQGLFPAQHQEFCQFLEQHLVQMPETTNESDPRNTQLAFMTTIPQYFFIKKAELKAMQKSWFVEAKGGDDAESAKIVRLEDLFDKPMFSAHARMVLDMMADKAEKDPNYLNSPVRQEQFRRIAGKITQREAVELRLVHSDVGAILQQGRAGNQLPVITGQAELTQFNTLARTGDDPMNLVDSTQDADHVLRTKLGAARYARMERELERNIIPASARVILADLCQAGKVNIILDNSSSMTGVYRDSEGRTSTRWAEAHERFKKFLPLLSLAGVKVELRFLNKPEGLEHKPYIFDFSKNIGSNEVASLERELQAASEFLTRVFASEPNGGTYVNKNLQEIFAANTGNKCLTLFLTDGDATDKPAAEVTLRGRNGALNPLIVVACTNQSNEIGWVRTLARQPDSCVAMLDDFMVEQTRLFSAHGSLIPYSNSIWLMLHLTAPLPSTEVSKGLQVYHLAEAQDGPLTKEELGEILGYEPRDNEYRAYLSTRSTADVSMAVAAFPVAAPATQGYFPGYGSQQMPGFPAGQQQQPPAPPPSSQANRFGFGW